MTVRYLSSADVAEFVRDDLLARERTRPIVGITTIRGTNGTWIDPEDLERELEGVADVVVPETGEPTWELERLLPPRLDVYGGALRLWWPGLGQDSDPYEHRLYFVHSEREAELARRRLVQDVREHAWHGASERWPVGTVVDGRVAAVKDFGVFVTVEPGVSGLVHKSEIDWSFVADPGELVRVGDTVRVQVLSIDVGRRRIELSMKQALLETSRAPAASQLPPTPEPRKEERAGTRIAELEEQLERVTEEAREAAGERATLAGELRRLRAQLTEAKRDLRSAKDALAALERRGGDESAPLASPRAFLLCVRLCFARLHDEDGRGAYPLRRMRVGRRFLDSARDLGGLDIEKLVEVCAQVACGMAHTISGRDVHALRAGERGAGNRRRAGDGASAWRCSLQDNTPSARRLHWWDVPGPDGGAIEFALVGVHDEFEIPE